MKRYYYGEKISTFLDHPSDVILGEMAANNEFSLEITQRDVWLYEIAILQSALSSLEGEIYFEYSIPRMGKRIDVVLLINGVVIAVEFKVGATTFQNSAIEQVIDYALDLKNFHEESAYAYVAPVLVASHALSMSRKAILTNHGDKVLAPICCNSDGLAESIYLILQFVGEHNVNSDNWAKSRYCPTPTIVEAAMALYGGHNVQEISRSDATATNLSMTSRAISEVIEISRSSSQKSICFVTGVPGAGKTLVGLDIATKYIDANSKLHSVFLSGNGPLVAILQEALARDQVIRKKSMGERARKNRAKSEVKMFIQNVHHFRDDCLKSDNAPVEHVALFDEAQRAWNLTMTANFMRRKKGRDFQISEPEYLISCMDRHQDWAVIVCLVGGGQEINTGEAGIGEWIDSLIRSYPQWKIYLSNRITDSEYGTEHPIAKLKGHPQVEYLDELHLSVSMRSFRAEHVSTLVKQLLDLESNAARDAYDSVKARYPIVLTRDVAIAKRWLREKARGSERYGIVVSSQAERLRPHAIHVRSPVDPVHWFLSPKEDTRSSYFLEDVATEFHIQGLELDWTCVTWDADFRIKDGKWEHWSFVGSKWQHVRSEERKRYQKNAYRVLLTRARQGMIIVVPKGDNDDHTRPTEFYDETFEYLESIGLPVLEN